MRLVGREKEIDELERIYSSNKPEFVVLFGRRRVGKTFLINRLFSTRFTFKHTALSIIDEETDAKVTTKDQLAHFVESLNRYGYSGDRVINNWFQAFYALIDLLEASNDERLVVFIDELPWLDTYGSKFVNAFESFWNGWANNKNIMLIVCGSANAWMTKRMLNNYGGLYGRITKEIELMPFSLKECREFFVDKNIILSNYDIVQSYMTFGGVPYYLDMLDERLSLPQNIDNLFFRRGSPLKDEFIKLFKSSFNSYEIIIKIVRLLFSHKIGYTRKEIIDKLNMKDGETIANALNALSSSGFVDKYHSITDGGKSLYYRLIDPFCLFYLNFVDGNSSFDENIYERNYDSQIVSSWRGFAFENVCFQHLKQIKDILKITVISSNIFPLIIVDNGRIKSQIDMVIDRKDNIVNLCEMKFHGTEYVETKEDYFKLMEKDKILMPYLSKKKVIKNVLITTFGLKKNEYSSSYNQTILIDDLFLN